MLVDIRPHEWNDVRIAAPGNHFPFLINTKLGSESRNTALCSGLNHGAIGPQIQGKGPQAEFKDFHRERLGSTPKPNVHVANAGLELLSEGAFVAMADIQHQLGEKEHPVVSVRCVLEEIDEKLLGANTQQSFPPQVLRQRH